MHLALKSEIHCSMTLPCAVDPEDRRLPVAHAKPDPSNVAPAPAALDAAVWPDDIAALAPDPADDTAEPAAEAAEVAAAGADDVAAVLLSLPQALSVKAPTTIRAISPLVRVIFTLGSSIECHNCPVGCPVRAPSTAGWRPTRLDRRGCPWTVRTYRVNDR